MGDWLESSAGTIYLIVGIEECRRHDRINLVVERRAALGDVEGALPTDEARVIDFYWHERRKRSPKLF